MNTLNLTEGTTQRRRIMTTRAALKAALRIAAKQDIRYYLNGINVEADATSTRLIATDGHRMLILHRDADNCLDGPVSFIIPREIARQVAAGTGKGLAHVAIDLCPEGSGTWSIPLLHLGTSTRLTFNEVPGKFPNWRGIVPKTVSGEAAQLSPAYLADMSAAAADLGSRFTNVAHNGQGPALIRPESQIAEQFIGLVMPMQHKKAPAWAPPAWIEAPLRQGDAK
nr:DNA polymerase III subunit beta [Achromobacter ruhlandii]